jgi:glycosyltransferase involved in cell wall biosynthesis
MKIVVDARMIDSSGIGVYIRNILQFMIDKFMADDLQYKLILLGNKRKIQEYFGDKIDVIECNSKIYSIREQIELPLKIPNCDLFWSPHYNIPIFYRGKIALTIHDICHIAKPEFFPGFLKQIYAKSIIKMAIKKAKVILTPSEFTLSELQKYFKIDEKKVNVIKNGVSNKYDNKRSNDKSILEKNNINNPYILYVGNIKPHKNIERLIKSYGILNKKLLIKVDYVFVGRKEGFISKVYGLEQIIREQGLNNIYFIDREMKEDDLKILYQNASCFVFPSLYEGFGLPPLEAMACGCPTVVSKVASLPEVCGDASYYVDPYDIESIADGIYKVLTDENLRNSLIKKGLERVKLFSWEKTAKETLKVIEEVLKR